jgi:hypothetical protein
MQSHIFVSHKHQGRPEGRPTVLLVLDADDQNLCSILNAKLDRVPPLMRSNRMRMSAELSPSSDVLLNPSSPAGP